MFKQLLYCNLYFKNKPLNLGYDFSFQQYVDEIKSYIDSSYNEEFVNKFASKFYSRYVTTNINIDDTFNWQEILKSEFKTILDLYNDKYNTIDNINITDLQNNDTNNGTSTSNANSNSEGYNSQYPEQLINHNSLEYASDGNVANTSSSSTTTTATSSKTGNRLDKIQLYLDAKYNIIEEAVNQFKHLFILIY